MEMITRLHKVPVAQILPNFSLRERLLQQEPGAYRHDGRQGPPEQLRQNTRFMTEQRYVILLQPINNLTEEHGVS